MKSSYETGFIALISCILLFASCIDFRPDKQIVNRYYLRNNKFGKYLAYKADDKGNYLDIVPLNNNNSSKIGCDSNYIIIKTDQYNYVIVPVYREYTYSPEKGILSKLNRDEFDRQKKRLGINARFTIRW